MALPAPKDRRPAAKKAKRDASAPPDRPPPRQPRPARAQRAPPPPTPEAPGRTGRRGDQVDKAAHGDATGGQRARPVADRAGRATRASRHAARKAQRVERDARLLARLRHVVQWVFPERTRRVGRGWSVLILVLNIAPFPGLGTALYGHWERGLLQFLLTFLFLVGWIWAVFDGIRIVSASWRPPTELRRQTPHRSIR